MDSPKTLATHIKGLPRNEYYRKYYKKNRKRYQEAEQRRYKKDRIKRCAAQRERALENRAKILKNYGSQCVCCGETRIEFLSIDHVHGGGYQERKKRGINGIYRDIIANNYPDKYRILCHNCNLANGFYGYCPHKGKKNGVFCSSKNKD